MVLHHIYLGKGSLASSILTGTVGAVVAIVKIKPVVICHNCHSTLNIQKNGPVGMTYMISETSCSV